MKGSDFISGLNPSIRNVMESVCLKQAGKVEIVFPQVRGGYENYDARRCVIDVPTIGAASKKALDIVNNNVDMILEKARINREADQAWMASPEGKKRAEQEASKKLREERTARAIKLAESTGVLVDEHGGMYSRGDHFTIDVHDVVEDPLVLKKFHASGKMLALVSQKRKRVYAKSYSYGPSVREDFFLIGENENGVAFAHAITNDIRKWSSKTVEAALRWIWGVELIEDVIDRHGDVAIIKAKPFKSSGEIGKINVIDSHEFTGEFRKNGFVYARNGILHHTKNQHPDVKIGNEWVRLKAANRSERRVATGSRD
jgi:hypothetical protein